MWGNLDSMPSHSKLQALEKSAVAPKWTADGELRPRILYSTLPSVRPILDSIVGM